MAYIESHLELRQHPKTRKLARLLGASVPAVIGHLHLLWWWTFDYAPDGHLGRFDAETIADGAMWEGDAETFISALTSAGFLDGGTQVHDWDDYAGKYIEKRRADAERKRTARQTAAERAGTSSPASSVSSAHPADVHGTSARHPADGARNPRVTSRSDQADQIKQNKHLRAGARDSDHVSAAPTPAAAELLGLYVSVTGKERVTVRELQRLEALAQRAPPALAEQLLTTATEHAAASPAAYALSILEDNRNGAGYEGTKGRQPRRGDGSLPGRSRPDREIRPGGDLARDPADPTGLRRFTGERRGLLPLPGSALADDVPAEPGRAGPATG